MFKFVKFQALMGNKKIITNLSLKIKKIESFLANVKVEGRGQKVFAPLLVLSNKDSIKDLSYLVPERVACIL